jgi:hypothetical protein
VPRRPGDEQPDPPGGRAAERRRAFLKGRLPGGEVPPADAERDEEEEPAERSGGDEEDR